MTERTFANGVQTVLFASTDVTATVDFDNARMNLCMLPEDLFDTDAPVALATMAALLSTPDACTPGSNSAERGALATRLLALFAAGAHITFTDADFRELQDRSAEWARSMYADSAELVAWVRRSAFVKRSESQNETGIHFRMDLGRGFGDVAEGLPDSFFEPRAFTREQSAAEAALIRERLLTTAAAFSVSSSNATNRYAEAVVMLALYAAGTRVELTRAQFRLLERRVDSYCATMLPPRFSKRNLLMARHAVRRARIRAKATGLI